MKRRRNMLLSVTVTATSMVAALGCAEPRPVGMVADPHPTEATMAPDAAAAPTTSAAPTTDASSTATPAAPTAADAQASNPRSPDEFAPRVGTTAHVPDNQR